MAGILNADHILTANEAVILQKLVQRSEQELRDLDTAIDQLQLKLMNLNAGRELLSKEIKYYRRLLSPIRRLLPEILQDIFVHCLPTAHNSVMSRREAPLLLCQVCNQWRQIAFATPRLWASIHIVIPPRVPSGGVYSPSLSEISSWLSRSGALPLSISVSSPSVPGDSLLPTDPQVRSYIDLLSTYASRWRSLHLSIMGLNWPEFLDQYSPADVPLLEKIYIRPSHLTLTDSSQATVQVGGNNGLLRAPRLRSLSIPNCISLIPQLPIRWSNITALELSGLPTGFWPLEDAVKALQLCPNLETCSISFIGSRLSAGISPDPGSVYLPELRSLSIEDDFNPNGHLSTFLERLHAPRLFHFKYDSRMCWFRPSPVSSNRRWDFLEAFSLFIKRLVDPLEELDLSVKYLRGADVIEMLDLLPGLRRLSLKHTEGSESPQIPLWGVFVPEFLLSDQYLRALTPENALLGRSNGSRGDEGSCYSRPGRLIAEKEQVPCLCPKLEAFHCTGAQFSDTAILNFLHSRSVNCDTSGVRRLKRVSIMIMQEGRGCGSRRSQSRIQALEAATGMSVDITYQSTSVPEPGNGWGAMRIRRRTEIGAGSALMDSSPALSGGVESINSLYRC